MQKGYSSPTESGIMEDLDLSVAEVKYWLTSFVYIKNIISSSLPLTYPTEFGIVQYSVFGSIVTIGGLVGGLVNGKIMDFIGRKGVSFRIAFCSTTIKL